MGIAEKEKSSLNFIYKFPSTITRLYLVMDRYYGGLKNLAFKTWSDTLETSDRAVTAWESFATFRRGLILQVPSLLLGILLE